MCVCVCVGVGFIILLSCAQCSYVTILGQPGDMCVRIQAGNISAIGPLSCAPLSALFCTICSLSAECKGRVHVYNAGGVNGVSGQDSR